MRLKLAAIVLPANMSYNLTPYDSNRRMFDSFWDENGNMLPWNDSEARCIYLWVKESHQKMVTLLRQTNNFQTIVDQYNSHQEIEEYPDRCKFIPFLTAYTGLKDEPIVRE